MSSEKQVVEPCHHMMVERIRDEHPVIDLNGHGRLSAVFKCGDCGQLFYAISSSGEEKKPKPI